MLMIFWLSTDKDPMYAGQLFGQIIAYEKQNIHKHTFKFFGGFVTRLTQNCVLEE